MINLKKVDSSFFWSLGIDVLCIFILIFVNFFFMGVIDSLHVDLSSLSEISSPSFNGFTNSSGTAIKNLAVVLKTVIDMLLFDLFSIVFLLFVFTFVSNGVLFRKFSFKKQTDSKKQKKKEKTSGHKSFLKLILDYFGSNILVFLVFIFLVYVLYHNVSKTVFVPVLLFLTVAYFLYFIMISSNSFFSKDFLSCFKMNLKQLFIILIYIFFIVVTYFFSLIPVVGPTLFFLILLFSYTYLRRMLQDG